MKHEPYLPADDQGKVNWLLNFYAKLLTYAAALGVTTGTTDSVNADKEAFAFMYFMTGQVKEYLKGFIKYKNSLRDGSTDPLGAIPLPPDFSSAPTPVAAGIFDRIATLVKDIKNNPNYNQTIGENLGIIGSEVETDFGAIQPKPKLVIKNSHAYLSWKKEHTQAMDINADYGDGAGYNHIARVFTNHYLDPHQPAVGQSKVFKYILHYVVAEEQVGVESQEMKITVTGPSAP